MGIGRWRSAKGLGQLWAGLTWLVPVLTASPAHLPGYSQWARVSLPVRLCRAGLTGPYILPVRPLGPINLWGLWVGNLHSWSSWKQRQGLPRLGLLGLSWKAPPRVTVRVWKRPAAARTALSCPLRAQLPLRGHFNESPSFLGYLNISCCGASLGHSGDQSLCRLSEC